jgi:enamine deaminase RidA (YjgF/YER057c/UK114 family)
MSYRFLVAAVLAACMTGLAGTSAAKDASAQDNPVATAVGPSICYLPLDAPAGMSQAVVVEGLPLVHTRQILPLDGGGKLAGEGSVDKQIEQVLDNLKAVLNASGSGLDKLVRLNVYAIAPQTVDRVRELLSKRLPPSVRPAISAVLTPLTRHKALVAVDAVAVGAEKGHAVALKRCATVAGNREYADAAVMPRGGVAYLSGVPEEGGLTVPPVDKSMSRLMKTLEELKLRPAHVVQVRVFVKPATSAGEILDALKKFFPGQMVPPVVFVEWIAPVPVEIELIACLPAAGKPVQSPEYYNPPDVRPAHTFSRVALVHTERQIFVSGLYARAAGKGEAQATDVFEQLQAILKQAGGDMLHLAKASYYVSDDDAGRGFDRVRPRFFDQLHPPAASKVMVHGVGRVQRTLTMDMIATGVR